MVVLMMVVVLVDVGWLIDLLLSVLVVLVVYMFACTVLFAATVCLTCSTNRCVSTHKTLFSPPYLYQVNALLERVRMQQAGLVEPPPITLPPEVDGDQDDDLEDTYGDWIAADDLDTQLQREASGSGAKTGSADSKGRGKGGRRAAPKEDEDDDFEELEGEMEDLLDAFQEQLEAAGALDSDDDDVEEGFFAETEEDVPAKQGRGRRR